jgi:hypothetical protein
MQASCLDLSTWVQSSNRTLTMLRITPDFGGRFRSLAQLSRILHDASPARLRRCGRWRARCLGRTAPATSFQRSHRVAAGRVDRMPAQPAVSSNAAVCHDSWEMCLQEAAKGLTDVGCSLHDGEWNTMACKSCCSGRSYLNASSPWPRITPIPVVIPATAHPCP